MCSIANIVINKQSDVIIKYMDERLETGTSLMDGGIAPVPVSSPTSDSAPASTAAKKSFASIVKTTQPIILKPSDSDAAVPSKEEIMSKANEALKKVKVRNARNTSKGTLVVEVSSERKMIEKVRFLDSKKVLAILTWLKVLKCYLKNFQS